MIGVCAFEHVLRNDQVRTPIAQHEIRPGWLNATQVRTHQAVQIITSAAVMVQNLPNSSPPM